jgi:hypothetical protein
MHVLNAGSRSLIYRNHQTAQRGSPPVNGEGYLWHAKLVGPESHVYVMFHNCFYQTRQKSYGIVIMLIP